MLVPSLASGSDESPQKKIKSTKTHKHHGDSLKPKTELYDSHLSGIIWTSLVSLVGFTRKGPTQNSHERMFGSTAELAASPSGGRKLFVGRRCWVADVQFRGNLSNCSWAPGVVECGNQCFVCLLHITPPQPLSFFFLNEKGYSMTRHTNI